MVFTPKALTEIWESVRDQMKAEIVEKACAEIGTGIVEIIPRCADIQFAENKGCTVFEALEASEMKAPYSRLAAMMVES